MKTIKLLNPACFLFLIVLAMAGCGSNGQSDTSGELLWYYTCGDPVCRGYTPPASEIEVCTSEKASDPCQVDGESCDPQDECNRFLTCATEDPTQKPGGCPISLKSYKRNIMYLTEPDMIRYYDEVVRIKLATYQYNNTPQSDTRRLGFIIDDTPGSASVLPDGKHVDLYGYTSMAVAALQVQARQIEALKKELEELKKEIGALRDTPKEIIHPGWKRDGGREFSGAEGG